MNITKKAIIVLTVLCTLQISFVNSFAANRHTIEIGANKTETRSVSGYLGIQAHNGVQVYITQGAAEKVSVTGSEDGLKRLKTEVKNGVLDIYVERTGWFWSGWSNNNEVFKVYVTIKEVNSLIAHSGANIYTTSKIKADKLTVKTHSGSYIKLEGDSNELTCESSSGSQMELIGSTKNFSIQTSSGSNVNAFRLLTETCSAQSSSGSNVDISVSKQLTANSSSGSHINYKGNPKIVSKNSSSGGEVSAH
ncbi:hypothetical protein C3K47_08560 [Solitalea longa]|uniref:Putative auto-transporter adhesin head GIN domain-containing protein n=1 Tax=Solitalea longa TaxID=2079460 RepID=A0A2S5A3E4_9SPHI|nr:head GIN domain-containing protein [Solitalea longa]POY37098.1 hypothetical protein C3K47_08560 [Solitalea longa]